MIAIGQDAVSFDAGNLLDYHRSVHTVRTCRLCELIHCDIVVKEVLGSGRVGIENLANVERLPNRGATIIALPLKLENGSGSPARVLAYGWQPRDKCRMDYSAASTRSRLSALLLALSAILTVTLFAKC